MRSAKVEYSLPASVMFILTSHLLVLLGRMSDALLPIFLLKPQLCGSPGTVSTVRGCSPTDQQVAGVCSGAAYQLWLSQTMYTVIRIEKSEVIYYDKLSLTAVGSALLRV